MMDHLKVMASGTIVEERSAKTSRTRYSEEGVRIFFIKFYTPSNIGLDVNK